MQRKNNKTKNTTPNLRPFAKKMRQNPTDAEKKLWYHLRNSQLGYKIRRQHQINSYICDFICVEKKVIIECDGGQHSNESDSQRSKILTQQGYKIIRFWNNEILSNLEGVLIKIKETLDATESNPS